LFHWQAAIDVLINSDSIPSFWKEQKPPLGLFLLWFIEKELFLRRIVEFGCFVRIDDVPPGCGVISAGVSLYLPQRMLLPVSSLASS
jgi:hypothetical protein